MPFLVHVPNGAPWIAAEFWGHTTSADVVGARREMAEVNVDNAFDRFIFDCTVVDAFDLTLDARDGVVAVDAARSLLVLDGKCAFVAPRETIQLGAEMLAGSSKMDLEFRTFESRPAAEAWLRGETPDAGTPAPRRRRVRS